jgi:hypothetical protein
MKKNMAWPLFVLLFRRVLSIVNVKGGIALFASSQKRKGRKGIYICIYFYLDFLHIFFYYNG